MSSASGSTPTHVPILSRISRTSAERRIEAMAFAPREASIRQSRVLVITPEPLRQNLSGPGVRALELARALAERNTVTVATPFTPEIADDRCRLVEYSFERSKSLKSLAEQADVI